MKKIEIVLLVILLVLAMCACGQCEHFYIETVSKEASCVEEGEKTFICDLCGESYKEAIPINNHDFEEVVIKEATCAEEGEKRFTCELCGYSYVEATPKTDDHNFVETISKESTCTEAGEKKITCSICDFSYNEAIEAKGHSYEIKKQDSTCTKAGEEISVCKSCGHTVKYEIAPLGHKWNDASCDEPKTCMRCGTTEGNPLGHDKGSDGKCRRCGKVISNASESDKAKARMAYSRLKERCKFPDTLKIYNVWAFDLNSYTKIEIEYSAENNYGQAVRNFFNATFEDDALILTKTTDYNPITRSDFLGSNVRNLGTDSVN